jgi:nucleoside-diphosphate-sugar epimerase
MEPDDYAAFPSYWGDARLRRWNLWGYVDCRDVAQAARLALTAATTGSEICIVAAADTVMTRPSADLMAEVFPDVSLRRPVVGRETLLSIDHARQVLGYEPAHRWSDHIAEA